MVQAILSDRKTQTRRIAISDVCPYGKAGDLLWVRETWRPVWWDADFEWMGIEYKAGGDGQTVDTDQMWPDDDRRESVWDSLGIYCSKTGVSESDGNFTWDENPLKWRPSIFMPRAACRIFLEIEQIKLEYLKDISEADAIAEGVEQVGGKSWSKRWKCYGNCPDHATGHDKRSSATASFMSLWNSINGAGAWDENPLVWVVQFKRIER
jgi:hypothetical protein